MRIIDGQKIAKRILARLKQEIQARKTKPGLAIILVGANPASQLYLRVKERAASEIGARIKKYALPARIPEERILEIIAALNKDADIHGILIQLPLPKRFSVDKIIKAIATEKDVDGFLPTSSFNPPFILAIWQALQATRENLKSKRIIILANSDIFGQTLCSFLHSKGLRVEYILGRLRQGTRLSVKQADVLITALGQPHFINGLMIKKEAILIDGGITKQGKRVIGDIDIKSVSQKASWLSPVPGGLGPMTVAFLFQNLLTAATLQEHPLKG